MSDLRLQKVKFILNPVLPFCHCFWSLTTFVLVEFAIVSPLALKPSLAHFDRQLAAVGDPLPKAFLYGLVLKMFIGIVQLLVVLHKGKSGKMRPACHLQFPACLLL